MSEGYLSRDREHLAELQRKRRAAMRRMDYMPGVEASAIIEAQRATLRPGSQAATNSAILDNIVCEWARLTGIKKSAIDEPMTSTAATGISRPLRACTYEFGSAPEFPRASRARAYAHGSDADAPAWGEAWLAANKTREARRRIICGAKRHRDGQPCKAMSEPGKRRCRFHGGRSTGPRTPEGKAAALANLRQNKGGKPPPNVAARQPNTPAAMVSGDAAKQSASPSA